ncbi:MAG: XdhC family protein [Pyrinomonadaceae bacterium]
MNKELELWHFVRDALGRGESVMLLVVAESKGSSPGRQGYKMAVGTGGELSGSIGGGVMEVRLVKQSRSLLLAQRSAIGDVVDQVHRANSPHASGMICSGEQTVVCRRLDIIELNSVESIIRSIEDRIEGYLHITNAQIVVFPPKGGTQIEGFRFERRGEEFVYTEKLGTKNDLYIVGGGHCSLALSELMSKMDFSIRIFDDRPDLNTVQKNRFADEITIIDSYELMGEVIPDGPNVFVVVMTLGYKSDEVVLRNLIYKDFKYFGVLGSKAKMATLLKQLRADGVDGERLSRLHTPIGVPINSHTPEEIAISIAAEIIGVKNA